MDPQRLVACSKTTLASAFKSDAIITHAKLTCVTGESGANE